MKLKPKPNPKQQKAIKTAVLLIMLKAKKL